MYTNFVKNSDIIKKIVYNRNDNKNYIKLEYMQESEK